MIVKTLDALQLTQENGLRCIYPHKPKMTVGLATCGLATGAKEVWEAISEEVEKQELDVIVAQTGCIGFCQKEPLVDVKWPGWPRILYCEMTSKKATELVRELAKGKVKKEWALARIEREACLIDGTVFDYNLENAPEEAKEIPLYKEIPFFEKQHKVVLRNCGFIDPENIEEYIARGGYRALHKALTEMRPEEVIEEIKRSGLRGRGGAGFPTGWKWETCQRAPGDIRYVICNADEGDPGAYMDRSVLEGDPHSILEGMIIGAYGVGAHEGYIYVRAEYPLAVERLKVAIEQAEGYGFLGENVFDSGFDFGLKITRGGGAFVCGESSALMRSIEGESGEPRAKHIHATEKGLWGKPTVLNNVKTWNIIPTIIARGADWYSGMGTEKSKGTAVFSVVGKINNTGLVEVPMGIPLQELVYDIGGGIPKGKRFKAVQTGGPSGGCIPERLLDLPVDYERLTEAGSMMGSGGMIVMDETTCMVDVAHYFLGFTGDESCGKCTTCREGVKRMDEILTDICAGRGEEGDVGLLEELAEVIRDASLCGLGRTAPNPVLTTIHYFRDEYDAHIREKRCPAGVCRELIYYFIDPEECVGCGVCKKNCPQQAITGLKKEPHFIDQSECIKCRACFDSCKLEAIKTVSQKELELEMARVGAR